MSLVSIIVPVYNVEKYLNECIESIVNQSYENIEILLINDGSTDFSGKMCDEWAKRDNRINVFHQKNKGISAARNLGIEKSKGEYLIFIDSDDYVDKNYVEYLYQSLVQNKTDMALCGFNYVNEDGEYIADSTCTLKNNIITRNQMFWNLKLENSWYYLMSCNKIYKKSFFDKVKYPEGKVHEDVAIFHYLVEQTEKISIIQTPLYYYRKRLNSITNTKKDIKRSVDIFDIEVERYRFFLKKGETELSFYFLKRAYSEVLQVMKNFSFNENKEIINKIVLQILKELKFNIRSLKVLLYYIKIRFKGE